MEKNSQIKVCGESIYPGESLPLAMRLPELYSCMPAYMPIKVFNGKEKGPTLLVFSSINGDELNGIEIIHRLTGLKRLKKLKGTLIAIPVVNVFGLANKSKYLPGGVILSESFPGSKDGTHAERIAHLFISELFTLADYAISLETGPLNYTHLPEVATELKDENCKALAKTFGAPVINQAENKSNTLQAYARDHKKKLLTFTAGETRRFDYSSIKLGVRGVLNVMSHLGMLSEKEFKTSTKKPTFISSSSEWVRTPHSGIASTRAKIGAHVQAGQHLASVHDPFGNYGTEKITSPMEGVIVGVNNVPLVKEGEALFELASFSDDEKAAHHFEQWNDSAPNSHE